MKLGVICDGISRDLAHSINVMDEFGLEYAELQFVGDKEVGDHSKTQIKEIDTLLRDRGKSVSCLSRHIFAGMTSQNKPGDELHLKHMDALKRVVEMAHIVGSPFVRIMTQKKEQILWGFNGAEKWNVAHGAWDSMPTLIEPAVDFARSAGVKLAVETGNGTMVNSNYTARKLIDELNAKDTLKVLWDPGNNCWCHELAFPDGYEEVRDGYLGHIHIKDVFVDTPKATLTVKEMGQGQLGPLFGDMAAALRKDQYKGVISFESVYHPGNGNFEDGFRKCIGKFKSLFGVD